MKSRAWGLLLVALGVMILLQVTEVFNFGLEVWPVLLLILGLSMIWGSYHHWGFSWFGLGLGLWVGGIGLFQILHNAGVATIAAKDVARLGWPVILVAIGISLIFGRRSPKVHICTDSGVEWSGDSCRIGDLYHGRQPWVLDRDLEVNHGIGDAVLDLTTAAISPGKHHVKVKAGIGEQLVRVPNDVNVKINASVGIGELKVFGKRRSGVFSVKLDEEIIVPGSEVDLHIDAHLGIGEMTVVQSPANHGGIR